MKKINISVISRHNDKIEKHQLSCREGKNLLDAINEVGIPNISVFGACNKQLCCHSCSVHILTKYDQLEKPTEEEIDVHSELGEIYRENSTRMSCQITVSDKLEGMEIEIPRSAFFLFNSKDDETSNKI